MTSAAGEAVALRERRPGLRLAADLARLAGADGRYGACDDATVITAVGRWTALISALEARRLEALRAVVRRNPAAGPGAGAGVPGDLPGAWLEDAGIQVGLELARGPKSVSRCWSWRWPWPGCRWPSRRCAMACWTTPGPG
jgi:hypothetical protein